MRKHHDLKILPIYYDLVREGRKTFEVRYNDRGFESADTVTLKEWDNLTQEYTGREMGFEIGYVFKGNELIPLGNSPLGSCLVVFSLLEIL